MVKLSRRKTMIGMGLLAGGSGATFSSASFSQSTESGADFRVVVDQQLIVRANNEPGDNVTVLDEEADPNPTEYLFGGDGHINTENINFGDVNDGGEAAVNGEQNSDLEVAVAVLSDEAGAFNRILQVQNEGDTDASVGITISEYGADVTDGPIIESEVDSAFTFEIGGEEVSSVQFETVETGNTEDISIDLALGKIDEDHLQDAADPGELGDGDVFGEGAAVDTVSLVDAIEVGVKDPSD